MTDERKKAILAVKHIMKPLPEGKQRAALEDAVRMLREDAEKELGYIEIGSEVSNLFKFYADKIDAQSEFDRGWNSAILEVIRILRGEEDAETNDV